MACGLNRVIRVSVTLSLLYLISLVLRFTSIFHQPPPPIQPNAEFSSSILKVNINSNVNYMTGTRKLALVDLKSGGEILLAPDAQGSGRMKVRKLERPRHFPCNDINPVPLIGKRGSFWVLYNYIMPTLRFACDESVTYTTHADHTYLDNLVPLVERWLGPVSLSLYTPGTDYYETMLRIHYLRSCSPLVRDFVSFHLFFGDKEIPQNLSSSAERAFDQMPPVNCLMRPSFGPNIKTFRKSRSLSYPVNVGRNVAREMATTHYVLASDIELYPSPNFIPNFLEMIHRDRSELLGSPNPIVFVLPVFELEANVSSLPYDKVELQKLLKKSTAQPFRIHLCPICFNFPKQKEWMRAEVTEGLHVFTVGKRQGSQYYWEPFYIGTKSDPMYDERLSWEGLQDKLVQAYILCLLNYEFHILDNAFLVHRPGIKTIQGHVKAIATRKQHEMIKKTIEPELNLLYGHRPGCFISKRRPKQ